MPDPRCPQCLKDQGLDESVDGAKLCDEHRDEAGNERRRGEDRRKGERRMFPRAEGRRMTDGRRLSDAG